MKTRRQLKRTKRVKRRTTRRLSVKQKQRGKQRGGALLTVPADALIARDGTIQVLEDTLSEPSDILYKD